MLLQASLSQMYLLRSRVCRESFFVSENWIWSEEQLNLAQIELSEVDGDNEHDEGTIVN